MVVKSHRYKRFNLFFSPATDDGDWDEVTDTMRRLNAKWRDVGRGLKVDTVTLDCLFQSHHHDPGHCMAELLKDWLDNCDEPSWRILAKVAFRMNKSVAKEIAQNHPGEKMNSGRSTCTCIIIDLGQTLQCIYMYMYM